jgi:hypothetical protein
MRNTHFINDFEMLGRCCKLKKAVPMRNPVDALRHRLFRNLEDAPHATPPALYIQQSWLFLASLSLCSLQQPWHFF